MLQLCSFNCHSLKNSISELQEVCEHNDIVFLQETWLAKFELQMLHEVHEEFLGLGVSSFDSTAGLLSGRPFGGLAILWKRALHSCITAKVISDRVMELDLVTNKGTVSFLNVLSTH